MSTRGQCVKLGMKICKEAVYMQNLIGARAQLYVSARAENSIATAWGVLALLAELKINKVG